MVLQPVMNASADSQVRSTGPIPAWDAIQATQLQPAACHWLINQPDHAVLAGDLAANFVSPLFPKLDSEIVQAIAIHDAGWVIFEPERNPATPPCLMPGGKPQSFFEVAPCDFVRAWRSCIDAAEKLKPIAALMVSGHFCRLAEYRTRTLNDPPADASLLRDFLQGERGRQERLSGKQRRTPAEIEALVDVLQFCDLLSLYLCCGAAEEVEFPQKFTGRRVRARRRGGAVQFDPSPFRPAGDESPGGVSLGVRASRYPRSPEGPNTCILPLVLW